MYESHIQPSTSEFMSQSQITAMVPQVNNQQGPILTKCYDFPNPTYRTVVPISILQGATETITVTFLSHNANSCIASVSGDYMISACQQSPFLKQLDVEAYGVDVILTGLYPGFGKAKINITGCLPMVTIYIEANIIQNPPHVLPVATSLRSSQNFQTSQMTSSMRSSEIDPLTGSQRMDGSGSWRESKFLKDSGRW
ncbi:hypothetical protein SS50377_25259 [Spironucleus salmonicida]|uniref:Uncharacterized protein n=1 Tax=Spironucleus salmonicida TaxID=348837 RepID=V6LBL7_9EUKA|nr:hypothetical protein SS50377_25259 [Spironucleus salmonicida]|eukprot:EST41860.1 hypothetical protein SS50377_18696 [Spironucleus salmonicida]